MLALLLVVSGAAAVEPPEPDLVGTELQVAEAIRAARQAVVARPEAPESWGELGRVLYAHAYNDEAVRCFLRAAELEPEEHRWVYLAARASELVDPQASLRLVRRALELEPGYAPARVVAGRLEEELGTPEAAAADYRLALEVDPSCAAAEYGLGRLLLRDDPEAALERLERARNLRPESGSILASLSRAYARLGRREEAADAAERARGLTAEVALDDPLRQWVDDAAVSTTGLMARASRAEQAGDLETAEALVRRLATLRDDDAAVQYNLGNFLYRHGRVREAEAPLRRALELDPQHARAYITLGVVLVAQDRLADALTHFDRPFPLHPEHASYFERLGKRLLDAEQLDAARAILQKALDLDPRLAGAQQRMGQLLVRQGRVEEAIARYETAIEIDPDAGGTRVDLAMALALMRRYAEAWEAVGAARRRGSEPPEDFLSWLRQRMNEPASAERPPD